MIPRVYDGVVTDRNTYFSVLLQNMVAYFNANNDCGSDTFMGTNLNTMFTNATYCSDPLPTPQAQINVVPSSTFNNYLYKVILGQNGTNIYWVNVFIRIDTSGTAGTSANFGPVIETSPSSYNYPNGQNLTPYVRSATTLVGSATPLATDNTIGAAMPMLLWAPVRVRMI